jgi:hypothetical protein
MALRWSLRRFLGDCIRRIVRFISKLSSRSPGSKSQTLDLLLRGKVLKNWFASVVQFMSVILLSGFRGYFYGFAINNCKIYSSLRFLAK